jgi:hypothetical protein
MPTITATAGPVAILKIGDTTVPASDWKFDIDPKLKDISNFVSGRTYIGTLAEGSMSFRMIWDVTAMPTDPAGLNLMPGASVTAKCFVDPVHFFQVTLLIGKVTPHLPGIEDVVHYEVESKINGPIIYPVIP